MDHTVAQALSCTLSSLASALLAPQSSVTHSVVVANGFEQAHESAQHAACMPMLVFVDPPMQDAADFKAASDLLAQLSACHEDIHVLIWLPITDASARVCDEWKAAAVQQLPPARGWAALWMCCSRASRKRAIHQVTFNKASACFASHVMACCSSRKACVLMNGRSVYLHCGQQSALLKWPGPLQGLAGCAMLMYAPQPVARQVQPGLRRALQAMEAQEQLRFPDAWCSVDELAS